VVIWGDHYAASDTAEALGMRGKKLTVITENKEFGAELEPIHKEVLKRRFNLQNGRGLEGIPYKHVVDVHTLTTVLEIKDDEVVCIDKELKRFSVPCDTVVFCKTKENTELFDKLLQAGVNVVNMGDSRQVRNVRGATTDGANAGMLLDDDILMTPNLIPVANLPTDVGLLFKENARGL
jgi:thioredoxin reductase